MLPIDEILRTPPLPADAGDEIGRSREGRPIHGLRFGRGPWHVSLIGGCHADEPIGPWTLRRLARRLAEADDADPLLAELRWTIVPHANPDGEHRNRSWAGDDPGTLGTQDLGRGFALEPYLRDRVRELPGDDIEFGFPRDSDDADARPENRAVAGFLGRAVADAGSLALHASLHGMGFAAGPWFLLDRAWNDRTATLRRHLASRATSLGYVLHDVERQGDKGFHRIERGFCTRPDSKSMQKHFLDHGNPDTAALFRPSSMEIARRLDDDCLTLVTEMPLFLVAGAAEQIRPADPVMDRFRTDVLPRLQLAAAGGGEGPSERPRAMPIGDQMRLQLETLASGIEAVRAHRRGGMPQS